MPAKMLALTALVAVLILTGCGRGDTAGIDLNGPTAVPVTGVAGAGQPEYYATTGPCITGTAGSGNRFGEVDFRARSYPASYSVPITVYTNCSARTVDKNFRGKVHFAAGATAVILPADYTYTAGDNGTHTFSFGQKSVPASGPGGPSVTIQITSSQAGYSGYFVVYF